MESTDRTLAEELVWFSAGTGAAPSYNTSSADPLAGLRPQTSLVGSALFRLPVGRLVPPKEVEPPSGPPG